KDSIEYKGMMEAYKKFGADKASGTPAINPMAQRMMATMPQRAQLSPEIQAQMQAVKAGLLPSANAQLVAEASFAKTISEAQQKGFDRESKEHIAQMLGDVRDRATEQRYKIALVQSAGR